MTKKRMSIESASPDKLDKERMLKYKYLAMAFSYPDKGFFEFFGEFSSQKKNLISEYDTLFRANEIWLYGTEYLAKGSFQKSNLLSDIMGFYRAFGLEFDRERPDSLASELEFMYYLMFKISRIKGKDDQVSKNKASICLEAQKKFFNEHLYPAAKKISETILSQKKSNFYKEKAEELLEFLESEERIFKGI